LPQVPVAGCRESRHAFNYRDRDVCQQDLVCSEEILSHPNVRVRHGFRIDGRRLFMLVRLMQVFAIERAVDGLLALSAAADRADLAANAWTVPPRPADITDGAVHILSIGMETGESMRTHLFIKVVVEHDEKES